jgi:hypothetical protein
VLRDCHRNVEHVEQCQRVAEDLGCHPRGKPSPRCQLGAQSVPRGAPELGQGEARGHPGSCLAWAPPALNRREAWCEEVKLALRRCGETSQHACSDRQKLQTIVFVQQNLLNAPARWWTPRQVCDVRGRLAAGHGPRG